MYPVVYACHVIVADDERVIFSLQHQPHPLLASTFGVGKVEPASHIWRVKLIMQQAIKGDNNRKV